MRDLQTVRRPFNEEHDRTCAGLHTISDANWQTARSCTGFVVAGPITGRVVVGHENSLPAALKNAQDVRWPVLLPRRHEIQSVHTASRRQDTPMRPSHTDDVDTRRLATACAPSPRLCPSPKRTSPRVEWAHTRDQLLSDSRNVRSSSDGHPRRARTASVARIFQAASAHGAFARHTCTCCPSQLNPASGRRGAAQQCARTHYARRRCRNLPAQVPSTRISGALQLLVLHRDAELDPYTLRRAAALHRCGCGQRRTPCITGTHLMRRRRSPAFPAHPFLKYLPRSFVEAPLWLALSSGHPPLPASSPALGLLGHARAPESSEFTRVSGVIARQGGLRTATRAFSRAVRRADAQCKWCAVWVGVQGCASGAHTRGRCYQQPAKSEAGANRPHATSPPTNAPVSCRHSPNLSCRHTTQRRIRCCGSTLLGSRRFWSWRHAHTGRRYSTRCCPRCNFRD